jgi:uncharacterized membrane protein YphA (DoxX/SURF4 family)
MTIYTLLLTFGGMAAVLTWITVRANLHRSVWMSFLQYFVGIWFVFSGVVKAIDPIGTAFKMKDYFGAFEETAKGCALKPIAGLFPVMSEYALLFSVLMIVAEIVIGIMLILGSKPKTAAWLFFIIIIFFTALTGFTYLTGFVPQGANFFDKSVWGMFKETNMRVTDCGCFGDFLKLHPKVSFFKDLGLMLPALLFLIFISQKAHFLFPDRFRGILVWTSLLVSTIFCIQNAFWDEPVVDFRPFSIGTNIKTKKAAELKAQGEIKTISASLYNVVTKELKTVPYEQYMTGFSAGIYPDSIFKVQDYIRTEPTVARTKVSDFTIYDTKGDNELTDDILNEKNYLFLVIAYHLDSKAAKKTIAVPDTTWKIDSVRVGDAIELKKTFLKAGQKDESFYAYSFSKKQRDLFTAKLNPLLEAAEKSGYKTGAIVHAGEREIEDFRHDVQAGYPFYMADEKLLETMIRSNPGVYLLKEGQIVHKWHVNQLPTFEEIKASGLLK